MLAKSWFVALACALMAAPLAAQEPSDEAPPPARDARWRNAEEGAPAAQRRPRERAGGANDSIEPLRPLGGSPRRPASRVSEGIDALPNQHGQVWREYDISPYTLRVTSTARPEQAVVDWILRETGYEAWHSEVVSLLCPDQRVLRVYHTPEMQAVVAEIVDRFVSSEAATHAFSLRVITVDNPNWRARAHQLMRPIPAQTQGVQAWLVAKEDATLLVAELSKRTDFRLHSSPHLLVNNGQSTVVSATRPRTYIRDLMLRPEVWPGFETEVGQIDEGFALELSPLLSLDGGSIDAVIKCNIDQVEKLLPVVVEIPSVVAQRQRTRLDVPQLVQCRLQERFHWPTDQVLVVGLGVVPTPVAADAGPLRLPFPLNTTDTNRADLLVLVESKGRSDAPIAPGGPTAERKTYHGRY